jgi:hypothetical protein
MLISVFLNFLGIPYLSTNTIIITSKGKKCHVKEEEYHLWC